MHGARCEALRILARNVPLFNIVGSAEQAAAVLPDMLMMQISPLQDCDSACKSERHSRSDGRLYGFHKIVALIRTPHRVLTLTTEVLQAGQPRCTPGGM